MILCLSARWHTGLLQFSPPTCPRCICAKYNRSPGCAESQRKLPGCSQDPDRTESRLQMDNKRTHQCYGLVILRVGMPLSGGKPKEDPADPFVVARASASQAGALRLHLGQGGRPGALWQQIPCAYGSVSTGLWHFWGLGFPS